MAGPLVGPSALRVRSLLALATPVLGEGQRSGALARLTQWTNKKRRTI
jgi:hypothetical protein